MNSCACPGTTLCSTSRHLALSPVQHYFRSLPVRPFAKNSQHPLSGAAGGWPFLPLAATVCHPYYPYYPVGGDTAATPVCPYPGAANPGYPTPGVANPGYPAPGVADPGYPAPGAASPGKPAPGAASPGNPAPGAASELSTINYQFVHPL